ncbi:hypothetical protein RFI_23431, partial [Reticulomyxa filosa]
MKKKIQGAIMSHGVDNTKQEDASSDKDEDLNEAGVEENENGDVETDQIDETEEPTDEVVEEELEEIEQEQEEEEMEIKEEDLDASDQKIVHLYEIVSELIEEQKARTQDLQLLMDGGSIEEMMKTVEDRNDSLLQSLQTEFELKKAETEEGVEDGLFSPKKKKKKKKTTRNDPHLTHTHDVHARIHNQIDEVDAQFELYNDIVKAFNQYLETIAEFTTLMEQQRKANGFVF